MIRRIFPDSARLDDSEALETHYLPPGRHHLRVNFVASLDGAVEVDGRSALLASGPADRDAFMAMRAVADVVMVGAGTARAERYGPVRLDPEVRERRRARGQTPRPPLAVVTASGDLDPAARMFGPDRDVIVYTTKAGAAQHPGLADRAEVVACGDVVVDVAAMVEELRGRGLGHILCEGGPVLSTELFTAGLVDELCLTLSPRLAGTGHRSLGEVAAAGTALTLHSVLEGDGMLLTRYAARVG